MLRRIPASLLAEWMAYDQVEPISLGYRGEVAAAQVASVIANVNRNPEKKRQPYTIEDFVVKYGEAAAADPEEVWMKVRLWAGRYKN